MQWYGCVCAASSCGLEVMWDAWTCETCGRDNVSTCRHVDIVSRVGEGEERRVDVSTCRRVDLLTCGSKWVAAGFGRFFLPVLSLRELMLLIAGMIGLPSTCAFRRPRWRRPGSSAVPRRAWRARRIRATAVSAQGPHQTLLQSVHCHTRRHCS